MAIDHAGMEGEVAARAETLARRLSGIRGMDAAVVPDETGNPFVRVHLTIDPARAGFSAHGLDTALARLQPRVIVRSLLADRGVLQVDVRRLDAAGLDLVADRLLAAVAAARGDVAMPAPPPDRAAAAALGWLADKPQA
jgi:hypothetical protein